MIQVRGLTKIYGKTVAIRDVSLDIERGEILGFLGPNGAGKTTTLRILTCHTPPTSGSAVVAGYDVMHDSMNVRRHIGYMPETIGLYEDMTVRAYVNFIAEAKGVERGIRRRRVGDMLEQTGLREVADRLIRNLSKGFRQRVGLAQALVSDPDVLFLDEPTVGLDPAQIREIRTLIKEMTGRKTVILSTHILPEVTAVCSRVAIINLGRIAAVGTPDELAKQIEPVRRLEVVAVGKRDIIASTLSGIRGVKSVKGGDKSEGGRLRFYVDVEKGRDVRRDIPTALIGAGCQLYELHSVEVSLEDVFVKVVMGETEKTAELYNV